MHCGSSTYRVGKDSIARHLQESFHPQPLQHWQGQATVQVLSCQQCQGVRTMLLLERCLKLGGALSRHHIPALQQDTVCTASPWEVNVCKSGSGWWQQVAIQAVLQGQARDEALLRCEDHAAASVMTVHSCHMSARDSAPYSHAYKGHRQDKAYCCCCGGLCLKIQDHACQQHQTHAPPQMLPQSCDKLAVCIDSLT